MVIYVLLQASLVAQLVKKPPAMQETLVRSPGKGTGYPLQYSWASLVAQMVKSLQSVGDLGSIPGLGRSPGGGNCTHSSILAWEILWTEEPWRLHIVHGVAKNRT